MSVDKFAKLTGRIYRGKRLRYFTKYVRAIKLPDECNVLNCPVICILMLKAGYKTVIFDSFCLQ